MRWLITNRNITKDGFGVDQAALSYWTMRADGLPADEKASWQQQTAEAFRQRMVEAADRFPASPAEARHICLFIHGFNEGWQEAARLYEGVAAGLFDGEGGLGELVSFDWASKGSVFSYLPDRAEARQTADDLTGVLGDLYDWLTMKQIHAAADPARACRARTSVIAHSMGNYVLEAAMNALWTRKNRPLLVSLLQEVLMVAADVDNDLFGSGESFAVGAGEGLANLSYRITALYTGRDSVLGASTGLKHFGKRRLGRAGLDRTTPLPDNVWDIDCTTLLDPHADGIQVHGEYFSPSEEHCLQLMRAILEGTDRGVLIHSGLVPLQLGRTQASGLSVSSISGGGMRVPLY
jgi:esterase/lipase superfamily enzyme